MKPSLYKVRAGALFGKGARRTDSAAVATAAASLVWAAVSGAAAAGGGGAAGGHPVFRLLPDGELQHPFAFSLHWDRQSGALVGARNVRAGAAAGAAVEAVIDLTGGADEPAAEAPPTNTPPTPALPTRAAPLAPSRSPPLPLLWPETPAARLAQCWYTTEKFATANGETLPETGEWPPHSGLLYLLAERLDCSMLRRYKHKAGFRVAKKLTPSRRRLCVLAGELLLQCRVDCGADPVQAMDWWQDLGAPLLRWLAPAQDEEGRRASEVAASVIRDGWTRDLLQKTVGASAARGGASSAVGGSGQPPPRSFRVWNGIVKVWRAEAKAGEFYEDALRWRAVKSGSFRGFLEARQRSIKRLSTHAEGPGGAWTDPWAEVVANPEAVERFWALRPRGLIYYLTLAKELVAPPPVLWEDQRTEQAQSLLAAAEPSRDAGPSTAADRVLTRSPSGKKYFTSDTLGFWHTRVFCEAAAKLLNTKVEVGKVDLLRESLVSFRVSVVHTEPVQLSVFEVAADIAAHWHDHVSAPPHSWRERWRTSVLPKVIPAAEWFEEAIALAWRTALIASVDAATRALEGAGDDEAAGVSATAIAFGTAGTAAGTTAGTAVVSSAHGARQSSDVNLGSGDVVNFLGGSSIVRPSVIVANPAARLTSPTVPRPALLAPACTDQRSQTPVRLDLSPSPASSVSTASSGPHACGETSPRQESAVVQTPVVAPQSWASVLSAESRPVAAVAPYISSPPTTPPLPVAALQKVSKPKQRWAREFIGEGAVVAAASCSLSGTGKTGGHHACPRPAARRKADEVCAEDGLDYIDRLGGKRKKIAAAGPSTRSLGYQLREKRGPVAGYAEGPDNDDF